MLTDSLSKWTKGTRNHNGDGHRNHSSKATITLINMSAFPQYQGGSSVSVFTAQGSNPAVNCKISGKSVHKVYDRSVKGYVYSCAGGMLSKIQFPKDEKTGLQLIQPYLVLQIFVPIGQHFSLELRVTDTQNTRRKMYLSTSFSELKSNPLHCQIPLSMIMRNTWISLALHVPDLFQSCFRVLNFRSLDVIIIGPICKLRKIFTMKSRLAQSVLEAKDKEECLPLEHTFAAGVEATNQVIDTQKIQNILGIAASVEGTPATFVAKKKYIHKADRHVNVAFGSRTPLPLSTVRIDTNLPHEAIGMPAKDQQSPHHDNVSQSRTMSHILNVSEPVPCPPQNRIASSATEKQPKLKALNPKASNILVPQQMWDNTSFPVQEEPNVDNLETDPILLDRCLDLTSKHGQRLQKLNRRREMKVRKPYQAARLSQKENNKIKERKMLDMNDSPPGSPPSGWDNNSNGGSDSFLFEQHFEELPDSDRRDIAPQSYAIAHSVVDSINLKEPFHMPFQNGCVLGDGDSYFEKKISCSAKIYPPFLHQNDWSPFARASDKLEANEQRVFNDPERSCLSTQKLGENGTQNCSNPPGGNMEDIARPTDKVLNSNKLQEAGGVLQHNGPFGSTEELWIVHDEGDFSDPSAFSFGDKTDKDTSQLAGSSITKSGIVQLSTRQFGAVSTGKPNFVVDTTGDSSSFPVSISANKEPTLNKLVQNSTLANMTDNQAKPTNVDMRKPLTSKLEDKELDLLYDPILDCYYDPKTNRYYELK